MPEAQFWLLAGIALIVIAADQNEIRSLINSPTAPTALRSSAKELLSAQAAKPLPTVRAIDPSILAGA